MVYATDREYFVSMVGGRKTHCGLDLIEALSQINSIKEMKRFLNGYVEWFLTGDNSVAGATMKAKANIGHHIRDLSFMQKLKWMVFCGVTYNKYRTTYA